MGTNQRAGEEHPLSQHPLDPFQLLQLAAKAELLPLVELDHPPQLLLLQQVVVGKGEVLFCIQSFSFIK